MIKMLDNIKYYCLQLKLFFYNNNCSLAVFFVSISFSNDVELSYAIKDAAEQLPVSSKLILDDEVYDRALAIKSRVNSYSYQDQSLDVCVTHLATNKAIVSSIATSCSDEEYVDYCKELVKIHEQNPSFQVYTCNAKGLDKMNLNEYDLNLIKKHANGELRTKNEK